jgi:hypothetical protein
MERVAKRIAAAAGLGVLLAGGIGIAVSGGSRPALAQDRGELVRMCEQTEPLLRGACACTVDGALDAGIARSDVARLARLEFGAVQPALLTRFFQIKSQCLAANRPAATPPAPVAAPATSRPAPVPSPERAAAAPQSSRSVPSGLAPRDEAIANCRSVMEDPRMTAPRPEICPLYIDTMVKQERGDLNAVARMWREWSQEPRDYYGSDEGSGDSGLLFLADLMAAQHEFRPTIHPERNPRDVTQLKWTRHADRATRMRWYPTGQSQRTVSAMAESYGTQMPHAEATAAARKAIAFRRDQIADDRWSVDLADYDLNGDGRPEKLALFWSIADSKPASIANFLVVWENTGSGYRDLLDVPWGTNVMQMRVGPRSGARFPDISFPARGYLKPIPPGETHWIWTGDHYRSRQVQQALSRR